ncbi:MAG: hypothetical protein ACK41W_14645 [Cyanobacteriota bacterium]|jgi:hypothetical protein
MFPYSKRTKLQTRTENQDFSVEEILSQKRCNQSDLIEVIAQVCNDSSNTGSSQTLKGFNAANEEKKKYKNLLLYMFIGLWLCCELICLAILYVNSTQITSDIKNLAATAAIQTLPSVAFGFVAGKYIE